jgi:hypothetical protein
MLSLRTHSLIFAGFLAAVILLGTGGNVLLAMGFGPEFERAQLVLRIVFFGLVLAAGFSLIPVMVKLVLGFHVAAGNASRAPMQFLAAQQNRIVWGFWALLAVGLAIAVPAAVEDGFLESGGPTAAGAVDLGPSQGVLVALSGMSVDDMLRQSTLKIDGAEPVAAGTPPDFAGGAVFDYRIPGSGITFHRCRYYFVSTESRDPRRIEAVSIGTSPRRLTRRQLDAANAEVRGQLKADGWLARHEEYRTAENQRLHGGATRSAEGWIWLKNDMVLHINMRRMDNPALGEDQATAGEWIQYVDLWPRAGYPGIDFLVFAPAQD